MPLNPESTAGRSAETPAHAELHAQALGAPPPVDDTSPGPAAAAPSRPSVPWDPHQDPPPAGTPAAAPVGSFIAAVGVNALYWGGAAVLGFLALTALFFNVLVRSADDGTRPDDQAASAEAMDTAAPEGVAPEAVAPGSEPPDAVAPVNGAAPVTDGSTVAPPDASTGPSTDPSTNAPPDAPGARPLAGVAAPFTQTAPSRADNAPAPARTIGGDTSAPGAKRVPGSAEVNGAFIVPAGFRRYDDAQHGFSLRVPTDWREAHRSSGPGDAEDTADYDVVFEAAGGEQRLAVSVWDSGERPPFESWLPGAVAGMQPLDDGAVHGEGVPYNAFIGGEPALVLGAAETPVSHLAYAAFLQHGNRYLRVAWADMTGLTRPDDVLGALASFSWVGDDLITGSATVANQVPRLALPQGVYWPSTALFGEDVP